MPKKTSSGKIGDKAIMEKGKIKEPNTLFRRLVRFHRWEIFKIPGKWLYRVGMVVPADLPWHPRYTVYATQGPIKGKSNARELAKRLNNCFKEVKAV